MVYESINLFSEIEKNKGFSEEEISKAENRLGFNLPEEIRLFYKVQGKNIAFKTETGVVEPQYLNLDKNGWLIFWTENLGVCSWAINKKEFEKKNQNIYIRHDGHDFLKEVDNLSDFLILRASRDCSDYIYPFRLNTKGKLKHLISEFKRIFSKPKSNVFTENHCHALSFWNEPDFVITIYDFSNDRGTLISVCSKTKEKILWIKNLFLDLEWKVIPNETQNRQEFIFLMEKDNPKEFLLSESKKYDNKIIGENGNDLPF